MTKLEFLKKSVDPFTHVETITPHTITKETEDECFAVFFREYDNRSKYLNGVGFKFLNPEQRDRYTTWFSDPKNYANNGGDMW